MKRNLVLVTLLLLGVASVASAQVDYVLQTTPTFVIATGRSEILGSVKLKSDSLTGTLTVASSFDYVFLNVACDNDLTNGVTLVTDASLATATINNPTNQADGCHITVNVPAGLATTQNVSFIQVQGVRGRVDINTGDSPGTGTPAPFATPGDILAQVNITPSGSSTISLGINKGPVASPRLGMLVSATSGTVLFCVGPPPAPVPSVTVTEGFAAAFVHHVTSLAGTVPPADKRVPDGGALNNTWVQIVVTSTAAQGSILTGGVTLSWPLTVAGTNVSTGLASAGTLQRRTTATATTQIYEFVTTSQGTSDVNVETFKIVPTVTLPATLTLGSASVQVNLNPPLITGDAVGLAPPPAANVPYGLAVGAAKPRFNDPPSPAATILQIAPCRTNLLFPWMAFISSAGYDTGFAISNTSTDPYGTKAQSGTCTLNFYPGAAGTTPTAGTTVAITTASIPSGAVYAANISGLAAVNTAPFTGYMIAVCNFQYGHGFGFITNTIGQPSALAQGYIALIIPDPVLNLGRLPDDQSKGVVQSGEGLGE